MRTLLGQAEAVLRGTAGLALPGRTSLAIWQTTGITCWCGLLYGGVMGSFGGIEGERSLQVVYAAVKVPLLLLASFAISLPSFFVLNTLLGVRADFAEVLRALSSSQAGLTIVLAAMAPYTVLWYASFPNYRIAILFNGLIFAVATFAAQWLLRSMYRPLVARHRSHRYLLRIWLVLYVFVAIQMAWVLRPFVGSPDLTVQFFRKESWGNAYVVVARMIWGVLAH